MSSKTFGIFKQKMSLERIIQKCLKQKNLKIAV